MSLDDVGKKIQMDVNDEIGRRQAQMIAFLGRWAGAIEASMKDKAPWEDRTSHARTGLSAQASVQRTGSHLVGTITLSHSMDYGYWLETRLFNQPHKPLTPRQKRYLWAVYGANWPKAKPAPDPYGNRADGDWGKWAIVAPAAAFFAPQVHAEAIQLWGGMPPGGQAPTPENTET